jgi:hypothetical protein
MPLRTNGSVGCVAAKKEQFGPMRVRAPTVMAQVSRKVALEFM